MQINFYGANCLRFKAGDTVLIFDDNLQTLSSQSLSTNNAVVCLTQGKLLDELPPAKIIFNMPGSYEVSDIMIDGIAASALQPEADLQPTIYRVVMEGMSLVVAGHIKPDLSEEQLEALDVVDVLFVPVGGSSTLDAQQAVQLVKLLSPKLVIPTCYQQAGLKLTDNFTTVDGFIQQLGAPMEHLSGSFKLKRNDLGEQMSVKVLAQA